MGQNLNINKIRDFLSGFILSYKLIHNKDEEIRNREIEGRE